MKVVVFTGPGSLVVEDRPDPVPEPGHSIIDVGAVGICGSDLHGYTGETGRRAPGMVMGHEIGGRLVDDGAVTREQLEAVWTVNPMFSCGRCASCLAGNDSICINRRVLGVTPDIQGGYAEYVQVPTDALVSLGTAVTPDHAALVEPLAVGYHAVRIGQRAGQRRAVVIGGGAIGAACSLAALRTGIESVLVSEPMAHRRQILAQLGVEVVDPIQEDLLGRVQDWTDGEGADLVLDAVASRATVGQAVEISRPGSPVVVVGMNEPSVAFQTYDLVTWERQLIGSFCYTKQHFLETAEWVATNPDELKLLVEGSVGFDRIDETFKELSSGSASEIKVLFVP